MQTNEDFYAQSRNDADGENEESPTQAGGDASNELSTSDQVSPEQRAIRAADSFAVALQTIHGMLPQDDVNREIYEALDQMVTAFYEMKKAAEEQAEDVEFFALLHNVMADKRLSLIHI